MKNIFCTRQTLPGDQESVSVSQRIDSDPELQELLFPASFIHFHGVKKFELTAI